MDLITLPNIIDERGDLRWVESGITIPFEIKRIFYMTDAPESCIRGDHAHRKCQQFIIMVKGQCMTLSLDYGGNHKDVTIRKCGIGIYIPPMVWCSVGMSPNNVCLVLASEHYDEADYIREYFTFIQEVRNANSIS